MIAGIGVDVVDLARFTRALERTPALAARLFAEGERDLPLPSLAARFAAKEALVKALAGARRWRWTEAVVATDAEGAPGFALTGALAEEVAGRGIRRLHLSLTHDAGVACAFVVAETDG